MIIAISGTPGTGKTTAAKKLATAINYRYVSLNEMVIQSGIGEKDDNRKTIAVDLDVIKELVDDMVLKDAVVEGIMAYAITNDVCIVLRCHPDTLRERLAIKKWGGKKIDENIEAEKIGYITVDALDRNNEVFEVDTTGKSINEVADICAHIAARRDSKYLAGKIDWLD